MTVLGGLTLNANVYLSASDTYLYFNDTNPQAVNVGTIASSATIHLSGAVRTIDNQGSQIVTFASGITISAEPNIADGRKPTPSTGRSTTRALSRKKPPTVFWPSTLTSTPAWA